MHIRMPSHRRQGAAKGAGRQGTTVTSKEDSKQGRAPRSPNERDESADSQEAGEPSAPRVGQAAAEDIERGVVDTDKGPVLDQVYDKVRGGSDDPAKKFSP